MIIIKQKNFVVLSTWPFMKRCCLPTNPSPPGTSFVARPVKTTSYLPVKKRHSSGSTSMPMLFSCWTSIQESGRHAPRIFVQTAEGGPRQVDGRPKLRPAGPGQMDQRTVLHRPVARRNILHGVPKLLGKRWICLMADLKTFQFNAGHQPARHRTTKRENSLKIFFGSYYS